MRQGHESLEELKHQLSQLEEEKKSHHRELLAAGDSWPHVICVPCVHEITAHITQYAASRTPDPAALPLHC